MTRTTKSEEFLLSPRFIGGLTLLGVGLAIVGAVVVAVWGDLEGVTAAFRGVDEIGDRASALATVTLFAIPSLILFVVGSGLFTFALRDAGDRIISVIAFILWFAGLMLFLISLTFHASVTVWAGAEFARTGAVPDLYEQLRLWMNLWLQRASIPLGLLAVMGYGWAILQTGLLPRWAGWGAIGWGIVNLLIFLPGGTGAIALVYFAAPLLIGLALVTQRKPQTSEAGTTAAA